MYHKEDKADESIKMVVSTHKMLLHDYTKLINMILPPPFYGLKFILDIFLEIEFLYINVHC